MATNSEIETVPIELPPSIYEAFKKEGYDPLAVFISQDKQDEKNGEEVFVRPGANTDGPGEIAASDLSLPRMTIHATKLKAPFSCWCVWYTRWGKFYVPCAC